MNNDSDDIHGGNIFHIARLVAVSSFTNFIDRYPLVKTVNPQDWNFIMTIAGAFVGVTKVEQNDMPDEDKKAILEDLMYEACETNDKFQAGYIDCRDFSGGPHCLDSGLVDGSALSC